MKRLVFLIAAVVLSALSVNVLAQGTGDEPSAGSIHKYRVNSSDGINHDGDSNGHVGNEYTWWVASISDLNTPLAQTDFTVESGVYNSATVDSFSIGIKWNASAVGDTFFVVVKETDPNGVLCSNIKAQPVVPQNNFKLDLVALDAVGSEGDSLSRCAPDIELSSNGLTVVYDYGVDTVMFKLTARDIYSGWSFGDAYAWTNQGNTSVIATEYRVGTGGWSSSNPSTVPANANGTEDVYIRLALDNGDTSGSAEEGLSVQTIKLTLSNVEDEAGNDAVIYNSNDQDITSYPVQYQVIKARPTTSGIDFN